MALRIPPQTRVILIPSDEQPTREYVIGRGLLALLLALAGALALLVVVALVTWSVLATRAAQVPMLQKRLAESSEQLGQVRALTRELEQLRGVEEQVYSMLGVPPPAGGEGAGGVTAGGGGARAAGGAGASPAGRGSPAGTAPGAAGRTDAGAAGGSAPVGAPSAGFSGGSLGLISLPPPDLWPVRGQVSREFQRPAAGSGTPGAGHEGIDLVAPLNTPIKAAGKGQVVRAGWDVYLGNHVEIAHGLGYVTVYGHCSRLAVREGDRVDRGQEIAYLGGTGQATAPHLHFEVWKNGVALDPRLVLKGDPAR